MRTIKFRGKRNKDGEWIYGLLTNDTKGHYRINFNPNSFSSVVKPDTVGQLICTVPNTSMYVDNSQELYEDDLFTCGKSKTVYRVVCDGYGECYGVSNEGDKYGPYTYRLSKHSIGEIKIVGNYHDNPELLKGGKE